MREGDLSTGRIGHAPPPGGKSGAGYLMLGRGFFENPLWWEDRPFSRAEAWLDFLQTAAFTPAKRLIGGSMVEIPRGGMPISVRYLARRWRWSNSKVCLFLDLLEGERMITRERRIGVTILMLSNFDKYNTAGKRRESDGERDEKGDAGNAREEKRRPATQGECEEFCRSIGLPASDGEWFWLKGQGSGWKNGGRPIVDWRATVRAWQRAGYMASQKGLRLPARTVPLRSGEEPSIWNGGAM